MAATVTFKLSKPVVLVNAEGTEKSRVEELVIRTEVVAGDLRGVPMRDPMHFDDVLKILGRLSGQPDLVISKLALADLLEVAPLVGGFMQHGPLAGSGPSQS